MKVKGPGASLLAPLLEQWARAARVNTARTLVFTRMKAYRKLHGLCYGTTTHYGLPGQRKRVNGVIYLDVPDHRTVGRLAALWLHELSHLRDGAKARRGAGPARRGHCETRAQKFARRMAWRIAFDPPPGGWDQRPPLKDPPGPPLPPPPTRAQIAAENVAAAREQAANWSRRVRLAQTCLKRWERRLAARERALSRLGGYPGPETVQGPLDEPGDGREQDPVVTEQVVQELPVREELAVASPDWADGDGKIEGHLGPSRPAPKTSGLGRGESI